MVANATISTWAITAQDNTADHGRFIATALLAEGVIDVAGGSFQVAQDTGSNMQVKVGSGALGDLVAIQGDAVVGQGLYLAEHQDATVTLVVAASDPSQARIDRVVARVYDNEADSSGNNYADVEVLQGTPAGSPTAPALPSGAISLATIEVGAGVTAIVNANITDLRAEAAVRGQLVETVYFTSTGSFVKADYPWLKKVRVKVQASGGGGGGATGASLGGGGGGAGGYAEAQVAASALSASETVTVGAAGTGGAAGNNNGGAGNTSSFGTHAVAAGGEGGFAPTTHRGGSGGAASAGDLQIGGGGGGGGMDSEDASGGGGNSQLGGGGRGSHATLNGQNGSGYGGGGGGGSTTGASVAGGDGAPGIVIVDLFA